MKYWVNELPCVHKTPENQSIGFLAKQKKRTRRDQKD